MCDKKNPNAKDFFTNLKGPATFRKKLKSLLRNDDLVKTLFAQ